MSASRPKAKQPLTPLWVISLFISLTETVLGVALTKTAGGVQEALVAFVIVFPLLIASGFFLLLWFRPHHLYAPSDYSGVTGVREYIEAVTKTRRAENVTSAEALHEYWKPNGKANRSNQAKLLSWLAANELKTVGLTAFIRGDDFESARQRALKDLQIPKE